MKKTTILLLSLFFVTSCSTLLGNNGDERLQLPNAVSQWAIEASASDAYGGLLGENRDDQSPFAATGDPDVENCEDDPKAWVISTEDDGVHWLELTYDEEVFVSSVRVRETLGPGAVTKIELMNGEDYVTVWEGPDNNEECPGFFEKSISSTIDNKTINMSEFKTDTVRITLDTDTEGWNEIDAVELLGYNQKWFVVNNTVRYI